MRRQTFALSLAAGAAAPFSAMRADAASVGAHVADLRFGFAPVPDKRPGFNPAGDAKALLLPTTETPARVAVPGRIYTTDANGEMSVVRVPDAWNGSLIVAGTPATRSAYANDLIWGEFALARGYAFASGNKGVPYNAIVEPAATTPLSRAAYPVPFDAAGLASKGLVIRLGLLEPKPVPIEDWNESYRRLVVHAKDVLQSNHAAPKYTYAVGLSNGGAQVRTLLERSPELVDGGVEWSSVYWSPEANFLDYFPPFLKLMPDYIASDYRDTSIVEKLVAFGFPRDVVQADPAHRSLYGEYYSNVPPYYSDLTVYAYALLIDPQAAAAFGPQPCAAAANPRLPGACTGTGLALPASRANYVLSPAGRANVRRFAHSGAIQKPLVSVAGTHDAFITPKNNALAYARAIAGAKKSALHQLFLVEGGTHVDTFAAFGYGLQAQAPFAWAAFDRLVATIANGKPAPHAPRTVRTPSEIA